MNAFRIAATPHLYAGAGKLQLVPSIVKPFGSRVLLVTGAHSFSRATYAPQFLQLLRDQDLTFDTYIIDREPTPALVDTAVQKFAGVLPHVVVAIGGGSVLDAGKAIAAMLPLQEPVKDYLEGVGSKPAHPGVKIPFVAIPTTAGTGSEATKNAVLSEVGAQGYKKSLRHDNFVPNVAIVDPSLTESCPPAITASSGMDAFTQLLESYVSTAANPVTDALAFEGLTHIAKNLLTVYHDGHNTTARFHMALASYLSGVTLANAGLGLVHGFASSVGGYFAIAHGVVCSTLMPAANTVSVRKLRRWNSNDTALRKYARVGKLFVSTENKPDNYYIDALLDQLQKMVSEMKIPTLTQAGVTTADHRRIVTVTDNKNNPVPLTSEEMEEVLALAG